MQAVIAILAALVQRAATGEGAYLDVSVADGVVALMSLYVDEYFATGEVPGPRHNILTGRYACYDVYRCADDKWIAVAAIEPHFYANLCRALGCEQWLAHQTDDAVQDAIRADFRAAIADSDARRVGRAARSGRHVCVGGGVGSRARARRAPAGPQRVRRGDRAGARGVSSRSAGCSRAWTATSPVRWCATRRSPTPTRCLAEVGYSAAEIAALREQGVAA